MNFALLGMPNCGKSTLFRRLTGICVPTGNRPGVTVTAQNGFLRNHPERILWDLPGIRSEDILSADESVTYNFLRSGKANLLLAMLDVTDLPGQLPIAEKLLRQAPKETAVIIVLNRCDALTEFPDADKLSELFHIPCFPISAKNGCGIPELTSYLNNFCAQMCKNKASCNRCDAVHAEDLASRFSSPYLQKMLFSGTVLPKKVNSPWNRRLNALFLNPYSGIPLFFLWMLFVLYVTFSIPGNLLTDFFCNLILTPVTAFLRHIASISPAWAVPLLEEAIPNGVGAVLSFLPRIGLLFFFQGIMEQSGMSAAISKLFDGFFSKFGLRGDALTPMLLGYGCTVPALLCTRGMKDKDASDRCCACLPTITCSARMPLCLTLASTLLSPAGGNWTWLICAGVWVLSAIVFLLLSLLQKIFRKQNNKPVRHNDPLPDWQFPSFKEIFRNALKEILHFLSRAGGLILFFTVLIWFLSSWMPGVGWTAPQNSLLAFFGNGLAPFFRPLGFGDWRIVAALLSGLGAKEATLSTLCILCGGQENLSALLQSGTWLSTRGTVSFLLFYLFYFPCAATLSTLKSEHKKLRYLLLPLLTVYCICFLINKI